MKKGTKYPDADTLVCLVKSKNDFSILKDQLWYRIPVKSFKHDIRRFKYLAFYFPAVFNEEKYSVRYYGKVKRVTKVRRKSLFPDEPRNYKSDVLYYRLQLQDLNKLPVPVASKFPRKVVFIITTYNKLLKAGELNDLYHTSPLEDKLWYEFKKRSILAERQFPVYSFNRTYFIDFALFCRNANIDVECDGDIWHVGVNHAKSDNIRDNRLNMIGWKILRYSSQQLNDIERCIKEIKNTIIVSGGMLTEEEVARYFVQ